MATGDDAEYLAARGREVENLFEQDNEVYKAGGAMTVDHKDMGIGSLGTKNGDEGAANFFPTYSERDLSVLNCKFKGFTGDLWAGIKNFFDTTVCVDAEVNPEAKVIFGNYYKTPDDCSFLASVAQMDDGENNIVLDVRRLGGDAFILSEFFKAMKEHLCTVEEFDHLDEEDSEEFDDDDEDFPFGGEDDMEEDGCVLPNFDNPMMEFEYDPELLYMMIDDFHNTHLQEKNYFMSMLSHNAVRKENRNLMLGEDYSQKVRELVEEQLNSEKDTCDATLMRNTCLFLKNLAEDMEVVPKTVHAAVEAMARWCPGDEDNGRYIGCLQSSGQAVIEIAQFFNKISKDFEPEKIQEMIKNGLTESQYNRICQFAEKRGEEVEGSVLADLEPMIASN